MKVFDKIKDLFADDEEEVETEQVKKEVIQVEIPAPKTPSASEEEVTNEEVKVIEKKEEVSPFFDDRDFEEIKRSNPTLEEMYVKAERVEAYQGRKEEVKKHFEPTPIISPVYGVLDKNYKKDDIVNKAEPPKENKDITLDEVRNKAYGTLEDELENTLFGRTSILFQDSDKKAELEEIEKDLSKTAEAIDMLNSEEDTILLPSEEAPKHEKKEDVDPLEDTMIAQALEIEETSEKNKKKKTKEKAKEEVKEEVEDEEEKVVIETIKDDDNISENDLFDLIDDMYGKGDN